MIRPLWFALAVVLVLAGGVVGTLGSVPGAWNGATLLGILLVVAGLLVGMYSPRDTLKDDVRVLEDGEQQ